MHQWFSHPHLVLVYIIFFLLPLECYTQCSGTPYSGTYSNLTISTNAYVASSATLTVTGTLTVNSGWGFCNQGTVTANAISFGGPTSNYGLITSSTTIAFGGWAFTNYSVATVQAGGDISFGNNCTNNGIINSTGGGITSSSSGWTFTNNSTGSIYTGGNITWPGYCNNYGCIYSVGNFSLSVVGYSFNNGTSTNSTANLTTEGAISIPGNFENYGVVNGKSGTSNISGGASGYIWNNYSSAQFKMGEDIIWSGPLNNYGCIYAGGTLMQNTAYSLTNGSGSNSTANITVTGTITDYGPLNNYGFIQTFGSSNLTNSVTGYTLTNFSSGNISLGGSFSWTGVHTNNGCEITNGSGGCATSNLCSSPDECPKPFPIELLSFDAQWLSGLQVDVLLTWSTATEINNDYFTLERSTDAINFSAIGMVDGAGNSYSVLNYQYIDNTLPEPTGEDVFYYRLKQTDYNGTFSYGNFVALTRGSITIIGPSPNIIINELNFSLVSAIDGEVRITIYDMLGQLVNGSVFGVLKGMQEIKIPLPHLASGVYILQVSTMDRAERTQKQFIVK